MIRRLIISFIFIIVFAQAAAAAPLPLDPTQAYLVIQRAFLGEDFRQVASLARLFVADHPDLPETPRVWVWLALSLDRLEQVDEALQTLDDLQNRLKPGDPLWPEALFWEADISRRAARMARAKSAYQQLAQRYPGSLWVTRAQLGLGLSYLSQQAFEIAVKYFHGVAQQEADSPIGLEARLFEGLCELRMAHFPQAIAILQPLLEQFKEPPLVTQAAFYLGESLSGLSQFDEAVSAYQRALDTKDNSQWTRYALFGQGWAHFRAGRCPESVKIFDRYLAQTALDHRTEALFAKGSCLIQMSREPEALAIFRQILARDLDHPLALESGLVIVDAYRREEQFALAKSLIHTLLRRRIDAKGRAQLQLRLAAIALDQGNSAQAQTVYRLAADHSDASVRQVALNGLADVQVYVGNLQEAKRFYERTLQILPQSGPAVYARYQLGRILLQLGDPQAAITIFEALMKDADAGFTDDARLALALAYVSRHQHTQAREQLETIRTQRAGTPSAARAGYYLALLMLGDENEAGAERLCRETIAGAPKTEEAADARLLLADLTARRTSVRGGMRVLQEAYRSAGQPARYRAKFAKRIADFAREEGSLIEAIWWYDEAAVLLPSLRDESAYRAASCYEAGGDVPLALAWYQAAAQPPWSVRGRLAAAKLLERQERLPEAQKVYEALAGEDIPEAKIARERLAVLRGEVDDEE